MRYHVLHIKTSFAEEWQKDLFDQQLCDLGVDTIDGEDYYITTDLWLQNQVAIRNLLSTFDFLLSTSEVPDENWNAVWEAEHPIQELPMGVKIIPHCAFGAGHHETTGMMIEALLQTPILNEQMVNEQMVNVKVLDNGTGTGVLAVFAKKLGAGTVIATDIDDKAVANARENAALNNVELDVRAGGDLAAFDFLPYSFDLIMANIHRNVLLTQMGVYARLLNSGGELWMSGFYEEDCPPLLESARKEGLLLLNKKVSGDWRMLQLKKSQPK